MRKRKHVVSFHLSPKELRHLQTQVDASGLPREELLRTLIMGAELHPRPCLHHAELLHKMAGLCNNANQLAHVANSTGQAGTQRVEEMTAIARQVYEEVLWKW